MKNFKRKNGITLIALVITIIVMLILVAVTINIAVNGGLFGYAGKAAQDTETKKQEELNWTNISANMSNDQLIAKYTGVNPDLAKLRKYYIDRDETAIPNAREEIEQIIENGSIDIIKYNNAVYKIISNYDESTNKDIVTVGEIKGDAAFPYLIMANGTELFLMADGGFYDYQNEIYKVTRSETAATAETLGSGEVVVAVHKNSNYGIIEGYIQFTPKQGEKWYQWAEDTDFADIDLQITNSLTLKQIIAENNTQDDKTIKRTFRNGRYGITITLRNNDVVCKTNSDSTDSDIIPHTVYVF